MSPKVFRIKKTCPVLQAWILSRYLQRDWRLNLKHVNSKCNVIKHTV